MKIVEGSMLKKVVKSTKYVLFQSAPRLIVCKDIIKAMHDLCI
jgi:hypothetical protein